MESRLVLGIAVGICAAGIAESAEQKSIATKPNILFIAVDDLRPAMACYGDQLAVTPNMDRLAKRSVQFNNAYCQVAVCNPSRASLMTGLRPDKLGVWTLPIHFREAKPDAVTMPQWFREFGYTAVSHGKIYHNPTPDPQSWSEPIRALPPLPYPYPEGTRKLIRKAKGELPAKDWRKKDLRPLSTASPDLPDEKLLDGARTQMAIEDMRRLGKTDDPFFLAMGFIRPHLAWIAPQKYWDLYDPADFPVLNDEKITPNTPPYALHNNSELTHYVDLINLPRPWDEESVAEEKARKLMHGYYACVSYVDAQIGLLLDALEKEDLADNTIIVLWSDHGWKLGEYRGWGKMTNYEIDARVPLLISTPRMKTHGQQSDQVVELLDLYPSLCELAGIDTPDFLDGSSLVPILKDVKQEVHRGAVNQYYRKWDGREYMGYSIRSREYRLVEWRDFTTGEVTARELFDHRSEHSEKENIVDSAADGVVEKLTTELLKTHPRKGLSLLPAIHSKPSKDGAKAKTTFVNQSQTKMEIYSISTSGRRGGKSKRLQPSEKFTFNSRVGIVFVVESADGKTHQIHSSSLPDRVVKLKE